MEDAEMEENCFYSDDVTYLRDAGKQPYLNTMIRDLEQGSPWRECEESAHGLEKSQTPCDLSIGLRDKMISPLSKDPVLISVHKSQSELGYQVDDNYNKSRYSPEIVHNPRQRPRKIPKSILKENNSATSTSKVIKPTRTAVQNCNLKQSCTASTSTLVTVDQTSIEDTTFTIPSLAFWCLKVLSKSLTHNSEKDETEYSSDFDSYSPVDSDPDYQLDDIQNTSPTSYDSIPVDENQQLRKRKRAKRSKSVKENWVAEANKIKRMRGESYNGRRKTEDGKVKFDMKKKERCLKSRCEHNNTCKFFECHKVTEELRSKIFKNFWKQTWEGKKVFVEQTVQKKNVVTRKCSGNHRRKNTFKYTFNTCGTKISVCKKMYLNTLNIGEWSVHSWTKYDEDEKRERQINKKTTRNENLKSLEEIGRTCCREFLNKLPKLDSHYCRKTTSKLYLEPIWQSKRNLYREYIRDLTEEGKTDFKVSINLFKEEFETMNLSLFSPKKDQCDLCCSYNVGNVTQDIYIQHNRKKERARSEKTRDKENIDPNIKVYTFDLQAVLLSPALKASALYYKSKLKVHNFTIFDLKTSDAHCFIWNESEGGVSADEFASILNYFITNHVGPNAKHVILWSDGCTNQNRNAILANSLLQVAVHKNITIEQKYLEKGHTQMECDSMHSTIERQLRNREIYSPAQYVEICRTARLHKPYNVHYLRYDFFRRFSTMPYLNSIRPGKRPGESTVFDLRCIQYRSDGKILVKKDFSEDFMELPRRIKKPGLNDSMPQLYESRVPIQRSKYRHLQELKEVLPHDVHLFYDDLPHICPDLRRNNETCTCKITITRSNN